MKHILGIGNALVDVMTQIDNDTILEKFSLPKGSMTLVDNEKSQAVKSGTINFKRNLASGGSAANTIHGLAMLKANAGFIGSIGNDETGDFFENDMKIAGVKTMLFRRSTMTGTAVALISPDSERTFATHLGAAVELYAEDLKPELFKSFNILYLEGYLINDKSLVEKACRIAREKNMEVALDLASYNVVLAKIDDFRDIVKKYVDIIFANEQEARSFTGLDPEKALNILAEQCNIAVVKTGKEGSLIRRKEEIIKISSLPVDCRDTTGAGDLYAAGFLYGYANNLTLDKCGALGSLLAGNVIELVGARIPEKRWQKINSQVLSIVKE
ncbi:MAG: adenosine kinase [Bacteroidales bacterium]|nr:adenosine kinase [Bacteroidales bacterium]